MQANLTRLVVVCIVHFVGFVGHEAEFALANKGLKGTKTCFVPEIALPLPCIRHKHCRGLSHFLLGSSRKSNGAEKG